MAVIAPGAIPFLGRVVHGIESDPVHLLCMIYCGMLSTCLRCIRPLRPVLIARYRTLLREHIENNVSLMPAPGMTVRHPARDACADQNFRAIPLNGPRGSAVEFEDESSREADAWHVIVPVVRSRSQRMGKYQPPKNRRVRLGRLNISIARYKM